MRVRPNLLALAALCALTSCHLHIQLPPFHGLASFPVTGPGDHAVILPLDATLPVKFSNDLDMTFDGFENAGFTIDLVQDDVIVGHALCDPFDVLMCSPHIQSPSNIIQVCRMRCAMRVPKSGPTLVRATFATLGTNVNVLRANLIVEQ